jgi:hypothetical protein
MPAPQVKHGAFPRDVSGDTSAVVVTPVGWSPRRDITLDEWVRHGRRIGLAGRGAGWWIGDWLNYGHTKYGEKYVRAARVTGYDSQTLMNMAYVASRFEISRRRENLSWSHHAELASLEPNQQDRWLDRAEAERISVHSLRVELRSKQHMRQRTLEVPASNERRSNHDSVHEHDSITYEVACPKCGFRFSPRSTHLS